MLDPERTHITMRKKPLCPICRQPVQAANAPFCSSRCRMIDLNRWLEGVYRMGSHDPPEGEE